MDFYEWKFQTLYPRVEAALQTLGYVVHQAADRLAARDIVLGLLPRGHTIGLGGSRTLLATGLLDALRGDDYQLLDWYDLPPGREQDTLRRSCLQADDFLTGVDAITRDGKLIFLDETGHRAASVLYGPQQVCVVAGMGKVVPDVQMALRQARGELPGEGAADLASAQAAAPEASQGECESLHHYNALTILDKCLGCPGRIHVVLIMEQI